MLDDLLKDYYDMFGEIIELTDFISLPDDDQIEILKRCIASGQPIYKSEYYIDNYLEEVKD